MQGGCVVSPIIVRSEIERTARVMQIEGMFDIHPSKYAETIIPNNIPDLSELEWNVGLIVGPSGAGKSTVAKHMFGTLVDPDLVWSEKHAVVDAFPKDMTVKDVSLLLSSVGFSSPPAWLRPHHTLSTGEKFRTNMARLLAEYPELVVVDEFTSVVDRTVAQIGSAAIAKTVRRRNQKFVAVTCHYDVAEWLQPDWTYEPASGRFELRSLRQRPQLEMRVFRSDYAAWKLFSRHHYLTADVNKGAHIYVAEIGGQPAALVAVIPMPSGVVSNAWRMSRTVVMPDFQGVGVAGAMMSLIGAAYKADHRRSYATTAHPAMIMALNNNPLWRITHKPKRATNKGGTKIKNLSHATNRMTAGFEYIGPPDNDAVRLLPSRSGK